MTSKENSFSKVSLGTAKYPLPVWDRKTRTGGALMDARGALSIYTMHDDAEGLNERIYAELMRNYPSRNMIQELIHELKSCDPSRSNFANNSYVSGFVGGPGTGKSFMFKLLGKLVHPKGALYLNCKGVDVGSIFSETVFDSSGANTEKAAIDARIIQGLNGGIGLKPDSVQTLRSVLGDAVIFSGTGPDETLLRINWDGIRLQGSSIEQQDHHKMVVAEALRQVCDNEGIKVKRGGIQLGITTRDGMAIRAMDQNSADYGRRNLLDELNFAEGSVEKLFEWIAFLSDPKVTSIELIGGENRHITFRRDNIPPTFRFNFTLNPATKGMARAPFDSALMSRFGAALDLRTVPDAEDIDFADRIAGYLTGAPVTQIYSAGYNSATRSNIYDENPGLLVGAVKRIRTMALTDSQKAYLEKGNGQEELLNIENASKIIKGAHQFAEFFDALANLLNPDSTFFEEGQIDISPEYESYLREIQIDLRIPTKLLEKAGSPDPVSDGHSAEDVAKAFAGILEEDVADVTPDFGDLLADRGKRLESFTLKWLRHVVVPADAKTRGINTEECERIYRLAMKEAHDHGIGVKDLNESTRGNVTSLHTFFDIDRFENPYEQKRVIRDAILAKAWKEAQKKGADEKLSALFSSPDAIMKVDDLDVLSDRAGQMTLKPSETVAVATSLDRLVESPFGKAFITDPASPKVKPESLPEVDSLVSREGLILPMVMPQLRQSALQNIWKQVVAGPMKTQSEAHKLAAGKSATGLGVTSLLVQNDGNPDVVHVLKGAEKLIVVSGAIDPDLKELLKRYDVSHYQYGSQNAARQLDEELLASEHISLDTLESLKTAFLLRNGDPDNWDQDMKKTLGSLMTDVTNVQPVTPLYVSETKPMVRR